MKNLFLSAICGLLMFASCGSDSNETATTPETKPEVIETTSTPVTNPATAADTPPENVDELPIMTFAKGEHDFGTIQQGDAVEYEFEFTNTGKTPLIISAAKGSCGCTVPVYPTEPVAPGATEKMLVKFDSKGKKGKQKKAVNITHNGYPNKTTVYINVDINAPETEAPAAQ